MSEIGIFKRVSTDHQEAENQDGDLARFTAHHGHTVTRTYVISESAWNGGKDGGEYRRALGQMLDDAHAGHFKILVVWALDRVTREGAEGALRLVRQLKDRGVTLVSIKESWLNAAPEVQDVLVAFAGWMAQQESTRRSERIQAGLARRRAEGKPVGRQSGSADKKPRKRSGYVAAWEDGGARRTAAKSV